MKFIISTVALVKHLQLIEGVVNSNTVLPILEDFLFDIKDGKLTVFATDLETSMSAVLDIETKEEGKIAIPAKMLMNILRSLPDQPLTFSVDSKNLGVEITSDNGKYKLTGENGDDFPRIPVPEDIKEIKMASPVLANAITKTLFAVSTDELRPAMTGVYVELTSDGTNFVATDAHKLVRYTRKDSKSSKTASFIVPRKAMNLLSSALPTEDTQIKISYNSSNAFFNFGGVSLICRLIDARFPDYNAVIPTDNPNKLTVNSRDLLNSLKRLSIFASKTTHQVTIKVTGNALNIFARDLDFSNEADEQLKCQYNGENMEIAFNARFLIDMLTALNADDVQFSLSTPTRAALLAPTAIQDNEDILMLVMPIMLNN